MNESIRVLYVADESALAGQTTTSLKRETDQLRVDTEPSASDALKRLASDDFDCIVSGYDLPGMNGIKFLRAIREEHDDLPFILFTSKGSEDVASDAISAGVSDYLQKQASTDQYADLAARIVQLVNQYRAQARLERLAERQRKQEQNRQELIDVTSDPGTTPEGQIRQLLAAGCGRLGADNGHLVTIDADSERHEVISVSGFDIVQEGVSHLSETYCRKTIESDELLEVYNAPEQGWEGDPAYERFGLGCYIGKKLSVEEHILVVSDL